MNDLRITCLRYYIPFYFDNRDLPGIKACFGSALFTRPYGRKSRIWQDCEAFPLKSGTDIYHHIRLLTDDPDICTSFRYNKDHLRRAMEKQRPLPFTFVGCRKTGNGAVPWETRFDLGDVYAHLFSTGIGFLSYEVRPLDIHNSEDLFDFQCQFKELCHDDKFIRAAQSFGVVPGARASSAGEAEKQALPPELLARIGAPSVEKDAPKKPSFAKEPILSETKYHEESSRYEVRILRPFQMGSFFQRLMRETCPDFRVSFFARSGPDRPDKAILMSYIIDDRADDDSLRRTVCHLARGYNAKYRISKNDLEACLALFDNVYCYAALEGCCIAVRTSEDNRTFFVNNAPYDKYGYFFFLALFQHYSLLRFSERIVSGFPSDPALYQADTRYEKPMELMITEINTHLMKCDFATVSHIHHHNLFYLYCRDALFVNRDKQSLTSGFEYLMNIQRDILRRQQEEQVRRDQEEKAEQLRQQEESHRREVEEEAERDSRLNTTISLLAIISCICDGYTFFSAILSNVDVLPLIICVSFPVLMGCILVVLNLKKRRKKR